MDFGPPNLAAQSMSRLARATTSSEILRIGAEVRARKANGASVCNLTVGDFDPAHFPIPARLREGIVEAIRAGHSNYPPSDGVLNLREAVSEFYAAHLGLRYPVDSVLIASGARPLLYAAFRALLDPGEVVVYPVPSWNNNHYADLTGARAVEIPVGSDSNFFPRPEDIAPHLESARLLVLNSPLNPTGTMIAAEALRAICQQVVAENQRRHRLGQKWLWLLFDQVYWQLTFGGSHHQTPPGLVPEVAPYTLLLDAASKSYAATGLRVGWGLMPPEVRHRVSDLIGHVGAWAPKAEQVAMAGLLRDEAATGSFRAELNLQVRQRLALLTEGFRGLKAEGFPVEVVEPQGAIYLSVRVMKPGLSNEAIRKRLLDLAGFAVVPFQAFGQSAQTGWFRLSVGSVSLAEIADAFPRLRAAL